MIEIVPRDGPPEAMLCAAFICDACREQVVGEGNISYWTAYDPTPRRSPVFAAHKGSCDQLLERVLGTFYNHVSGWMHGWEELRDFTKFLTHNSANAFAEDSTGSYRAAQLIVPPAELLSADRIDAARRHRGLPPQGEFLHGANHYNSRS